MLDLPRQWMVSIMDRGKLSSRAGTVAPKQLQSRCPELSVCSTWQGDSRDCRGRPSAGTAPQQATCLAKQLVTNRMTLCGSLSKLARA